MPDYMRQWFPHTIARPTPAPITHGHASPPSASTLHQPTPAPAGRGDDRIHSVVVIGGGPAGTALLTAATKRNRLPELARSGLVVVERDDAIGGGRLGNYAITSDSTAATFLSAVRDNVHPELAALMEHPSGRQIARYSDALGVPLAETGPFLRETGRQLHRLVETHGGSVLTGHEAVSARQQTDGLWHVRLRCRADGSERTLLSRSVVIATGGHQPPQRLAEERFAGVSLMERVSDRLIQSDEVVELGGVERLRQRLSHCRAPRIAILGGSTSALSTAALLLKASPSLPLGANAITLLHRRPLRPFYPSAEAAHAEGFTDFGSEDICPVSGFVYRLAGLRLESRELLLRMLSLDGRAPDPRLRLHRMNDRHDPAALELLDQADVVIAALGYRPHALPLFDASNNPLALAAQGPGRPAMVDRQCRVMATDGQPIRNLYGIGLAAGFVPSGELGGEPSFAGQANGLWLWQNDVGMLIVESVLQATASANESASCTQGHATGMK
ncbi:pyridine nucleotide-disulfide oxidoreductase [Kushneria sinocarnis]|uniref:Pyridine nucleotide-disulfide oxidoreductase n=1 Tax=Kushneria sinocarnis TaxID=595502 RepID=A0A420WW70_9GAMM|nr:FAD-dependent oxidoreductase [Kushneria sinocarnis]RKR03357.1 pyridine nucleotide-disulfide oxidoreductase [Kushneria sinocarnis]